MARVILYTEPYPVHRRRGEGGRGGSSNRSKEREVSAVDLQEAPLPPCACPQGGRLREVQVTASRSHWALLCPSSRDNSGDARVPTHRRAGDTRLALVSLPSENPLRTRNVTELSKALGKR